MNNLDYTVAQADATFTFAASVQQANAVMGDADTLKADVMAMVNVFVKDTSDYCEVDVADKSDDENVLVKAHVRLMACDEHSGTEAEADRRGFLDFLSFSESELQAVIAQDHQPLTLTVELAEHNKAEYQQHQLRNAAEADNLNASEKPAFAGDAQMTLVFDVPALMDVHNAAYASQALKEVADLLERQQQAFTPYGFMQYKPCEGEETFEMVITFAKYAADDMHTSLMTLLLGFKELECQLRQALKPIESFYDFEMAFNSEAEQAYSKIHTGVKAA